MRTPRSGLASPFKAGRYHSLYVVRESLPPVILALIFQRFIMRGLTAGAVK